MLYLNHQTRPEARVLRVDIDRATALYRSGMSLAEVAAELGMSPSGIDEQLRKAGVVMRRQGAPRMDVDDDWILQLRAEGLTWREISDTVGMTQSGVRTRHKKAMAVLSQPTDDEACVQEVGDGTLSV